MGKIAKKRFNLRFTRILRIVGNGQLHIVLKVKHLEIVERSSDFNYFRNYF